MNPSVSIIVPIYNAETFLRRCVESVLNQEYTDFELLLADDGSRDDSGAICDEYAAADNRVRVFHKENSGVSDARNLCLDKARGRYLQFLDADDWITSNATKLLVRAMEEHQCDMVISDFYRVVGERVSPKGDIDETRVLSREEYAAHMMENPADYYYGVLWNKLYRREIVERHHLRMDPAINWCEDFMFNLEYIRRAETFVALQVPIYYYVKTKGSLCTQGISISKTVQMKLTAFEYYNQFYKAVLDEEEYEKQRLKIYRFLIDAAEDGAVPPVSKRLGSERVQIPPDILEEKGVLFDLFRERKLLDYYLEATAQKNGLSLPEARLLLCLQQFRPSSRKVLADFAGLSQRRLVMLLNRLEGKRLISVMEPRSTEGKKNEERRLQIDFSSSAGLILKDLENIWKDFKTTRFSGFSEEEQRQYEQLAGKIQENIQDVLQ